MPWTHIGSRCTGERRHGPVRTIIAVVFAAAIAVTGCTAPVDRQASIYPVVLRQYLTSGDHSVGSHGFPRIFVLDRAVAGTGAHTRAAAGGEEPIPPAVQRAITETLADVGRVTFVASPNIVIEDGCARVRDEGILITLAPLVGVGDRVEVGVDGFFACLGGSSVTYALARTDAGWVVHDTTQGAVS